MTIPVMIFGLLLSSLYGALFHLWKNGGLGRLLLFLALSWVGFVAGQLLGQQVGWTFWSVGTLNVGMATIGSLIFLGVGYWLSLVQVENR
jgi:hypothetical protein